MPIEAWITLAIGIATMVLLILERLRPTLVMARSVLSLYVAGVVDQHQSLAGFANESLAIVAALCVLAGAALVTGAFEGATTLLLGGAAYAKLAQVCSPSAAASAFIANTRLVAMLAPQVIRWCRHTGRSPSGYLMPLSYALILDGSMTMIGTSSSRSANDPTDKAGIGQLSLFSTTGIGLPLAVGCVGLIVLTGPRPLRDPATPGQSIGGTERKFALEMTIAAHSILTGTTVAEAGPRSHDGVFLVEVERTDRVIAAVGPDEPLAAGHRSVFLGNLERLLNLQ